ncbi:unnamed protein product [Sympodiomycopsis kandeliae]
MTSSNVPTLAKGDLVLVTGASGWLGSHVAESALEHGLRVRLVSRAQEKVQPLADALGEQFGSDRVQVAIVPDFVKSGAYDEAVKGVQGIVHAASDISFSDDYDSVVGGSLKGYEVMLNAAKNVPELKRFVFTSSSVALGLPNPNGKETQQLNRSSWNEKAVKLAQTPEKNAFLVYAASKVITEQYVWKFVKENNPHFIVNSVNPNMILGAKVPGFKYASTGNIVRQVLIDGDMGPANMFGPQYHIDAYDTSLLHVLALTRQDITNERILAFGEGFSWRKLIDLAKELRPDITINDSVKDNESITAEDNTVIDTSRTQEILKEYGGFKSLRHSIEANLRD